MSVATVDMNETQQLMVQSWLHVRAVIRGLLQSHLFPVHNKALDRPIYETLTIAFNDT
jgi:hypothetical protein